jgi:hypothetical protein
VQRQHVAEAAHGLEQAGRARVVAELGAQARDLHVDGAVEGVLGAALGQIEELLARERAPGPLGEHAQEGELVAGQAQLAPVEGGAHAPGLEGQRPDADHLLPRAGLAAVAAHDRADARDQLDRREGLGDVVVGARLEAEDLVGLLPARGDHDDRHVLALAEGAADLDAVEAGQVEIEQHQVVLPLPCRLDGLGAAGHVGAQQAAALEEGQGEPG